MVEPIGVMLVDQDEDVRFGIRRLLAHTEASLAAERPFGTEAVARALEVQPDVICCGLEEPFVRPLETIEAILNVLPSTPVIVYSSHEDIDVVRKAMLTGAREFLVRPFSAEAFDTAMRAVLGWEEQRRMRLSGRARQLGARGTIVSVFSAKGGVGKTTIATNLATALAKEAGQSVALVDGDTSFGDVLVALNVSASSDLMDLLRALATDPQPDLDDYLVPHPSGVHVLPGPRHPLDWNTVDATQFRAAVELLSRHHDYVVVDLNAGANPVTMAALDVSSLVFWILSPDVFTLRDNIVGIDLVRQSGLPTENIRFIVNHAYPTDDVPRSSIEAATAASVYWEIPYDRALHRHTQLGETVEQQRKRGAAAKSIVGLARELAGLPASNRGNGRGRFRLVRAVTGAS